MRIRIVRERGLTRIVNADTDESINGVISARFVTDDISSRLELTVVDFDIDIEVDEPIIINKDEDIPF